ncbi:MAG: phosphoglycerate kinase [Patescibacteria group bacterium]
MKFLSDLKQKNLRDKTCLLRVDFNIQNVDLRRYSQKAPFRIEAVLPTIKFLTSRGAKVVILSHRGRPKGANLAQKAGRPTSLSLKPFVKILSSLLKNPVNFITLSELGLINKTKQKIKNAKPGSVFLVENLRFFPVEEKNDKKFAKRLSFLGDIYINDAFAVSHRKNASVVAITKFLPSYAGLLLEKEIKNLNKAMKNPQKPLVVILGGAKISDKISVIKNFLKNADCFLLGGGVANTFFAAQDLPVGGSLYDKNSIPFIANLLKFNFNKLILPIDLVVHQRDILDIGLRTIEKYSKIIKDAKTIIWNGPMGYIEDPKFANGSKEIAKVIMANKKAFVVVGGGETVVSLKSPNSKSYILNSNVFISTGGGAMLEYLAGKKLSGITALNK